MKINTKIRYGIRTMLELSMSYQTSGVLQKDIAENQEISNKYLDHIIASLKTSGLIIKNAGRNGGYSLSRSPEQITTYDIYKAFESNLIINECLLDPEKYEQKKFFSVVDFWEGLNSTIINYLENETLASLTERQIQMNKQSELLMYYI